MDTTIDVAYEDHVDPLKKLAVLKIRDPLKKGDYNAVQTMAHGFAKANDCVLERIRNREGALVLEVLIKVRLSPLRARNPLKE